MEVKGYRWLIIFEAVPTIVGDQRVDRSVLKLVSYKEAKGPYERRKMSLTDATKIERAAISKEWFPDSEGCRVIAVSDDDQEGPREVHPVVQFGGNAGLAATIRFDFIEGEDDAAAFHQDLRFRAVVRSRIDDSTPLSILKGVAWNPPHRALALAPNGGEMNEGDIPSLGDFDHILPVFYMAQPEGYFLVAELIANKEASNRRQFLVSVYNSADVEGGEGQQLHIFSPRYDVVADDVFYTFGFHQDQDGGPHFEFLVGREDNFDDQFARYVFPEGVGLFDFIRTGDVEVGIGRWPISATETLHFHGDIKDIICDPWSECTRC